MSQAEGVLITGVYGSGKSSVAAEIAYLLEQQGEQHGERFALLVAQEIMTFLGWPWTAGQRGRIPSRITSTTSRMKSSVSGR